MTDFKWLAYFGDLSPTSIGLGLLAACGVFLALAGLGLFDGMLPKRLTQALSRNLSEEQIRITGAPTLVQVRGNLLERAVVPLAQALMRRTKRDQVEWVELSYDLLGRDKGATDFYVRQVLACLAGICVGILLGVSVALYGDSAMGLFGLPVVFGLAFYKLPELEIKQDLARRREQLLYEAPHQIDRLLVNVIAYRNISDGLRHTVDLDIDARRALLTQRLVGDLTLEETREFLSVQAVKTVGAGGGGYFVRELMQVYSESLKNGDLKAALLRMSARNDDIPLVARFAERVAMSYETGASLVAALTDIGKRANDSVENTIQTRGEQNAQAMILPSGIALTGVFLAIGAPAMQTIMQVL